MFNNWKTDIEPELSELLTKGETIKKLWHMKQQVVLDDDRVRSDGMKQLFIPEKDKRQHEIILNGTCHTTEDHLMRK